ncbi:MAG: hypothetical protein JKY37_02220 [Nannocystaceae bacterium]|nr:hypothetical protein [Nannocystaceae bacterium]
MRLATATSLRVGLALGLLAGCQACRQKLPSTSEPSHPPAASELSAANARIPEASSSSRCASGIEGDPATLYSLCLACGEEGLQAKQLSMAEVCLDRAIDSGHAEGVAGTPGRLEAFEKRGDLRVVQGDIQRARWDYRRAVSAARSRKITSSRGYAALVEKEGDAADALGLQGEAFASFVEALAVVTLLDGEGSDDSVRLRRRVRQIARRLLY